MSEGERKALKDNPDSRIVFLETQYEISIVSLITQCPYDIGMNGYTGLKYDALKDFIRWMTPEEYEHDYIAQNYVPLLLNLGSHYANELNNRK